MDIIPPSGKVYVYLKLEMIVKCWQNLRNLGSGKISTYKITKEKKIIPFLFRVGTLLNAIILLSLPSLSIQYIQTFMFYRSIGRPLRCFFETFSARCIKSWKRWMIGGYVKKVRLSQSEDGYLHLAHGDPLCRCSLEFPIRLK